MSRAVAAVFIPAGVTANTVVRTQRGGLGSVLIQITTTAAVTIYDSAVGAGGTVIGYIPSGATPGNYVFDMPAAQGVVVAGASTNPAMTVGYY
jgi:hypothetical protein